MSLRIELRKRDGHSALFSALSPILAFALTVLAGGLIFALLGKSPVAGLHAYFIEPLTEIWSLHELAIKAAPLILIAVGLSLCFRSSNWNIGAEGQFIVGAMAGSILPIMFPDFRNVAVLPAMMVMGMAGGALYAAIPAYLKARWNSNEILTSLMLVYVAQLFLDWSVRGPWRNPEGFNFPESRSFHSSAILPQLLESGRAHYGIVLAVIVAVAGWFLLSRTMKGFEIAVTGASPKAARFAGFSPAATTLFVFGMSGALAGLAGISEVSGAIGQLRPSISPGYGFTAIIVAFLGRLNPLGIIAAGLLLALTYLGSEAAQISIGVSSRMASVFQGILLLFVLAADTLIHYRVRLVGSRAGPANEGGSI